MNHVILLGNVEDLFPQDNATTIHHIVCLRQFIYLFIFISTSLIQKKLF